MENLLRSFLNAFNKNTDKDFEDFIGLLSAGLPPRPMTEQQVLFEIQRIAQTPEQKLTASRLSQQFTRIRPTSDYRLSSLYVIMELAKHMQTKQKQLRFATFDFQSLLVKKAGAKSGADQEGFEKKEVTVEQLQQDMAQKEKLTESLDQHFKAQIPQQQLLIRDCILALQGIDGQLLRLEISPKTGLKEIVVSREAQGSPVAFLLDPAQECVGSYGRLQSVIVSLQQSRSAYRREVAAFLKEKAQQQYLAQIERLNTLYLTEVAGIGEAVDAFRFAVFCQEFLCGPVKFLQRLGDAVLERNLQGVQLLYGLDDLEVQAPETFREYMRVVSQIAKEHLRQFIFQGKMDQEFYIQAGSDQTDWDLCLKTSEEARDREMFQTAVVLDLGRVVQYTQTKFKKFFDFEAFPGYHALVEDFANPAVLFGQIKLTALQQYANDILAGYLIREAEVDKQLRLIQQVMLGFNSGFVTQYAEMLQGITGELYRGRCDDLLAEVFRTSQLAQSFEQRLLDKLLVEIEGGKFFLTYAVSDIQCILEKKTVLLFEKIFKTIVAMRSFELSIVNDWQEDERNYNAEFFRLNQLSKVISNFLQIKLHQEFQKILQVQQSNSIAKTREAFRDFAASTEVTLVRGVLIKLFRDLLELVKQFKLQYDALAKRQQGLKSIQDQQLALTKVFQSDIIRLVAELVKNLRATKDDDALSFAQRIETVL